MESTKEPTKDELKQEFEKDFYQIDYLFDLKINRRKRKEDISAIIPTYNRCPFGKGSEDYKYNPLSVCINALLLQKSSIKEIIVVDDASTDNTKKVVEELAAEAYATKGIPIKYLFNSERKGCSVSRNIAAKEASGEYLFFLDDDCVPAPLLSMIAMIAIKKLETADKNFASLVLPVYDRSSLPRKVLPLDDLTRSFFKREGKSSSFNSLPIEYIGKKDKFLNKNLKILKPIRVYQTWSHFIIRRSKYLDVGGFPDFATWPSLVGEDQEFACRLIENAYSLYYLPDPKASSFHGAYGAKIGGFVGDDWFLRTTQGKISLAKFSEICESGSMSGCRVSAKDYVYSKIIATFCILYKRNIKEAINWAKKTYDDFVAKNKDEFYPRYAKDFIDLREEREEIWHRAINDGLMLLFNTEQKKLFKLDSFIHSLKVRGKLEEEAQKHMLGRAIKKMLKKLLP
jgi:glycosyltransferase involved in cell wall biosynthesis